MDRSLVKFYAGIKSEQTRKIYSKYLDYFLRFVKIKEANGLLQLKESGLQEMAEDYVIFLKNKELRKSSVDGRIGALELFFSMNDKMLNWKKIRKMAPEGLKTLGGGVWTNAEIRKMLALTTSKKNWAIIHTLASTGCRIGALPELRLRNVSQMPEGCKAILFYEGSKEEYYGFLTPEATRALDEYLEERRKSGELLKPESWLFRKNYRLGIEKTQPMTLHSFRSMMREILRKIRGIGDGGRREVAMFHGFRKRFDTILKNNRDINISLAERLMSHFNRLVPLDTFYHNPTKDILFDEFKKAIPDLTIDESERLRLQNQVKDEIIKKKDSEKDLLIKDYGERLSNSETIIQELKKRMDSLES